MFDCPFLKGVGKTSLLVRFTQIKFNETMNSMITNEFELKTVLVNNTYSSLQTRDIIHR